MANILAVDDNLELCKLLGHKDVKMTQRYARVTQKKLFEDMDKFIGEVNTLLCIIADGIVGDTAR